VNRSKTTISKQKKYKKKRQEPKGKVKSHHYINLRLKVHNQQQLVIDVDDNLHSLSKH
jgi:Tfp pilus tip-associated adhesin PilY1